MGVAVQVVEGIFDNEAFLEGWLDRCRMKVCVGADHVVPRSYDGAEVVVLQCGNHFDDDVVGGIYFCGVKVYYAVVDILQNVEVFEGHC